MEWDQDATQLMRGYLEEVRRLAAARGADGNAVANNVQQRLVAQVKASGAASATADLVRGVLAAAGSPESVAAAVTPPPMPPAGAYAGPPAMEGADAYQPLQRRPEKSSKTMVTCLIVACVAGGMVVALGLLSAILLPALARAREAARRASCQNNMKQVRLLCAMQASENRGLYPLPSTTGESFMFDPAVMAGEPLDLLQCPSDPEGAAVSGSDYIYLGYAVRNQQEAEAVINRYSQILHSPMPLELPAFVNGPSGKIERLRDGLPGAESIPVLVEWGDFHLPGGGNVVYLDGHTEFIRAGEKFPMTDAFFTLINNARM